MKTFTTAEGDHTGISQPLLKYAEIGFGFAYFRVVAGMTSDEPSLCFRASIPSSSNRVLQLRQR